MKLLFGKGKAGSAEPAAPAAGTKTAKKSLKALFADKKKRKKTLFIALAAVLAAAVALTAFRILSSRRGSAGTGEVTYTAAAAEKQNISVTLSGSGTLQPADSYQVTSLATGEILSADFEEGDQVEEGTVLYQIDTADAESSIESAELSLEKTQLSYENVLESLANLTVTAPADGTIVTLNVSAGDSVNNGQQIGTLRNSSVMSLKIPFNSADADDIYVGETATVTLDGTFETLSGTVTAVNGTEQVLTGNMLVRYVTIDVQNPGGLTDSTSATATIGGAACNSGATFTYKSEATITAKASGEVASVSVSEGDYVSQGATILTLSSSDIQQNVKSAELSLEDAQNNLESRQEALDDYTITSPISGTVIDKYYKAGDKLSSSSTGQTLCTIYDLSYLTMEISVDELDISEVSVGQSVTITADAVEGKTYTGTVTKVSLAGTTSNSVTAYPVTVRIDDTDGLLPGMNVDAEIVVESAEDAVCIPVSAVNRDGTVLVQTSGDAAETGAVLQTGDDGLPQGFEYVTVTLGVSDDDYVQITSGIEEGDIVAIAVVDSGTEEDDAATSSVFPGMTGGSSSDFSGGGGMSGGGSSGGMPQGGGSSGGGGGGGPMGG